MKECTDLQNSPDYVGVHHNSYNFKFDQSLIVFLYLVIDDLDSLISASVKRLLQITKLRHTVLLAVQLCLYGYSTW